MLRIALLPPAITLLLASGGCISHRARIEHPPGVAGEGVIGARARPLLPPVATVERPLPIDLPVAAWRRDDDGRLHRFDGRVTTPLPWWQRFPLDVAADAWPRTSVAAASLAIDYRPVPVTPRERLFQAAAADGWLAPSPPAEKDASR